MARWAPEETDTMAAIAAEVIAQVGTNRTVIGVDGQDGTDLEHVAATLVAGFEQHGVSAMAAAAPSTDPDTLRAEVVTPFRTTGAGDGVLVVHGHGLLAPGAAGSGAGRCGWSRKPVGWNAGRTSRSPPPPSSTSPIPSTLVASGTTPADRRW
ncbi:hypothetical protein [Curtobacterium sp. 24E2]|nr:hypothetical protein JN350_13505 [Curtobacterium sp. 24E2]